VIFADPKSIEYSGAKAGDAAIIAGRKRPAFGHRP
jgi:hypothetical protein